MITAMTSFTEAARNTWMTAEGFVQDDSNQFDDVEGGNNGFAMRAKYFSAITGTEDNKKVLWKTKAHRFYGRLRALPGVGPCPPRVQITIELTFQDQDVFLLCKNDEKASNLR